MIIADTIAAIATPFGKGGVAILRISGNAAKLIAKALLGKIPKPRYATLAQFKDENDEVIDEGIALYFPNPNSFTGEDVLELQGHGGPVVNDRLLKRVLQLGARLANPGEFSQRAFLNNKIDLAQAEAIEDLIQASSEQAARSAIRSLQGEFSQKIKSLVDQLIQLRMRVEATIDFPEEDIDLLEETSIVADLTSLLERISEILATAKQGVLLQEGLTVVIAGKPNAGKSSLLNCLSGRETAIVTEIAGTTRDVLREYIHLDGLPLHVIDTAGLRETEDIIEKEGVRRSWQEMEKADIILLVTDSTLGHLSDAKDAKNVLAENLQKLSKEIPVVIIKNKIDLVDESPGIEQMGAQTVIKISAKYGQGIHLLKEYLQEFIGFEATAEGNFMARRRHLDALERAYQIMRNGLLQLQQHHAGEFLAEDLRRAQNVLNEITGEFIADDLLGKIFSTFCIGK